jgi:hypothetical protein
MGARFKPVSGIGGNFTGKTVMTTAKEKSIRRWRKTAKGRLRASITTHLKNTPELERAIRASRDPRLAPFKRKVTRAKHNPAFGKRKSQAHIIEAVHLKPLKFWYWNGHAIEDKRTHAFIFPTRAAAYAKAKEIRNSLPHGFKALRVITA